MKQRRRPALILLGVALMAVFGLAGAWLATSGRDATSVVIARQAIEAGEPIRAADLGTTQVSGTIAGASTIAGAELENLVGKYATGPIPAGSLINPESLVDRLTPRTGTAVVGVGLKPSQMPAGGLRAGDAVTLVAAASPQGGDTGVKVGTTWKASVVTVGGTGDDGARVVSFELSADVAVSAATAAGSGSLAVVLDRTVDGR